MTRVEIVVAQMAPRKHDYGGNLQRLADIIAQITGDSQRPPVDVLALPETALTGYFLQGGVLEVARTREQMLADVQGVYQSVAGPNARRIDIMVGFIELENGRVFNSALYATVGGSHPTLVHVHRKFFLPTYGVFDEKRYINRGRHIGGFATRFGDAGMLICEDAWHSMTASILALRGANIIYIPIASPARGFSGNHIANVARWQGLARSIAEEHGLFVVTSNLVGFEGGKGFIGGSVIVNPHGEIVVQGAVGEECLLRASLDLTDISVVRSGLPLIGDLDAQLPDLIRELQEASTAHAVKRQGSVEDETTHVSI